MKKGSFKSCFLILPIVLILSTVTAPYVSAEQTSPEKPWDLVLKIEKINETLDIIDNLLASSDGNQGQPPTVMLRGMLQGGGWIDPDRAVVIGLAVQEPKPLAAALIPFREPNENFKNMLNASSGPNYYLTSLPPGQPALFSPQQEGSLFSFSEKTGERTLSLEIFIHQLLKKSESQIHNMMLNFQKKQSGSPKASADFSPEEARAMFENLLDAASNLDAFLIGLNLTSDEISASMYTTALENTDLYSLFSPQKTETIFNGYDPSYQITFKMAPFDVMGMVDFFDHIFGKTYQKLGLDFRQIASIADHFTGETAGGMTYDITGVNTESIMVLESARKSPEFFDNIYLPWLEDYSDGIQQIMEKQTGELPDPVFRRTSNTEVSGYTVVGVDLNFPMNLPGTEVHEKKQSHSEPFLYPLRMTIVDNLLLTAPHDEQLAELIETAKQLKRGPLKGALGKFEIDMTAYFNALKDSVPGLKAPAPMPEMEKIKYTFDLNNGRMSAESTMKIKDIQNIIAYFKTLSPTIDEFEEKAPPVEKAIPAKPGPDPEKISSSSRSAEEVEKAEKSEKRTEKPVRKDFGYFMDQGGLLAAYGNDAAAVKYYEKAILLDPSRSEGYYSLGVSLGEMGQYADALTALNQAIEIKPEKALYYYARGRIYLLAGFRENALKDIQKAAESGNQDARAYLQNNYVIH